MIHSKRRPVNKRASLHHFKRGAAKTNPRNVAARPMRGGFRL